MVVITKEQNIIFCKSYFSCHLVKPNKIAVFEYIFAVHNTRVCKIRHDTTPVNNMQKKCRFRKSINSGYGLAQMLSAGRTKQINGL